MPNIHFDNLSSSNNYVISGGFQYQFDFKIEKTNLSFGFGFGYDGRGVCDWSAIGETSSKLELGSAERQVNFTGISGKLYDQDGNYFHSYQSGEMVNMKGVVFDDYHNYRIGKGSTYLLTSSYTTRVTGLIDSFYYSNVIPDGFGLAVYNKDSYEPTCPTTTPAPTTTPVPDPCARITHAGAAGVTDELVELEEPGGGILVIAFDPYSVPDKLEIIHEDGGNGTKKATSSMTGPNAGPFDNTYGTRPANTIPTSSQALSVVQFIGWKADPVNTTAGQNLPSRFYDFIEDTGAVNITMKDMSGYRQLIWWEYDSTDFSNGSTVTIRVTGPLGTGWRYKRLCPLGPIVGTTPCPAITRQISKLELISGLPGDQITLWVDGMGVNVPWTNSNQQTLMMLAGFWPQEYGRINPSDGSGQPTFRFTVVDDNLYVEVGGWDANGEALKAAKRWHGPSFTIDKLDDGTNSSLTTVSSPVFPPWAGDAPKSLCVSEASIERSCPVYSYGQGRGPLPALSFALDNNEEWVGSITFGNLWHNGIGPCLPHGTYIRQRNARARFFAHIDQATGSITHVDVDWGGSGYLNNGNGDKIFLTVTGDGDGNASLVVTIIDGVVRTCQVVTAGANYTWITMWLPQHDNYPVYNDVPFWRMTRPGRGGGVTIKLYGGPWVFEEGEGKTKVWPFDEAEYFAVQGSSSFPVTSYNDRPVYRSQTRGVGKMPVDGSSSASHEAVSQGGADFMYFHSQAKGWVITPDAPESITISNLKAGVNGTYSLRREPYGRYKAWTQKRGYTTLHHIYAEWYGGKYVWFLSEDLDGEALYRSIDAELGDPWTVNWVDAVTEEALDFSDIALASEQIWYNQEGLDFSPFLPWVAPWKVATPTTLEDIDVEISVLNGDLDTYWLFWARAGTVTHRLIDFEDIPAAGFEGVNHGAWMITRGGMGPADKGGAVVALGSTPTDYTCPVLKPTEGAWYVPLGTRMNEGETVASNYIIEGECDPAWLSSPWEPGGDKQAIKNEDMQVMSSFLVTTTTTVAPTTTALPTTTTAVPTTTTAVPTTTTAVPTTTTAVPTTTTAVPTTTTAVPTTTTAVPTTTTAVPTTTTAVPTTTTAVPTTTTAVPTTTTAVPTTTTAVPTTTAEPSPSLLKAGLMMRWFAWDDPDSARASSFGLSKNVEVDGSVSSRDVIYPSYKSSLWPNLTGAFTDDTYIADFDSIAKSSTDVYGVTKSGVYITDAQYLQLPQIQYNSAGGQWDSFGNDIGFLTGVETSSDDGFTLTFWSKWDYPDGWDPSAYIVDYNLYSLGYEGSAASLAHMMKYEGNDIEGILQSNGSNSIFAGNSKNTPPAPIIHTTGEVWTFWAFSYGGGTLAQGTPPIAGSTNDASENLLWAVSTGGLNENHIRFYNGSDSTRPSDGFDEGLTIGGNVMANKGTTEWLDFGASQAFLLGYGGSSSRVVPMTGYISDFRLYSGILQTGQIRDIYTGQGLV
jgi:hypothetical protein